VAEVVERGDEVLVRADPGHGASWIAVELTPGAVQELDLVPGRDVVLLVKTRACRLLASLAPQGPGSAGSDS
jgi:ABC-type molybdate transport system ATPase subunit